MKGFIVTLVDLMEFDLIRRPYKRDYGVMLLLLVLCALTLKDTDDKSCHSSLAANDVQGRSLTTPLRCVTTE